MSAKATGAQPNGTPNGDAAKSRTHNDGSSSRAFTVEQKAAVIRVKKCKATAFYDILGLEEVKKSCSDSDIKKAYRKLSLLTHPDKNGYQGADEAFKMVSRAFQILSDPDKKSQFDRFGTDPDNRFASASTASPFSGFANRPGGPRNAGPMFDEEISPEELFRQFFGGGGMGMGGPFGGMGGGFGGPGLFFNMGGGPGIRVHQFGGNQPRRRPHNHEGAQQRNASPMETLRSLLPLLLLFIIPLLSSIFSGNGSTFNRGPHFRWKADPPYTLAHTSNKLQVPYFVNPADVADYTAKNWVSLDRSVEGKYVGQMSSDCEWEQTQRQRMVQEAHGFFFTDQAMLDRARNMDMPACRTLGQLTGTRYV